MTQAIMQWSCRVTVTTLALTALTTTALAQSSGALEEVVVTARKRAESVQDVPISISTLTGDEISVLTAGGADLRFLNGRLPSVRVESSFGRSFPRFYIRGLGNSDFDLNSSQPISLIFDEVVLENPIVKGKPVFDLEGIEVARGPQGTLFGRNTPAGVIKFTSVKPTRELDGYASASYGEYDTIELEGAVGGPLGELFSGRVSGQWLDRDDWIDNRAPGFEQDDALGGYTQWAVRGQLAFEPNDQFRALLTAHAWEIDDGTARVFRANTMDVGSSGVNGAYDAETVYLDAGNRNEQQIEASGISLVWDYDFGDIKLTSITGYETVEMFSRGDIDGGVDATFPGAAATPGTTFSPAESADGIPDLDQWTQEFRLTSEYDGPWNWLLGFYYFDEDGQFDTYNYDTFAVGPGLGTPSCDDNLLDTAGCSFVVQETEAWAIFGSVNYQLGDRWNLAAGLRYTDDEKESAASRPVPVFQTPTLAPIVTEVDDDFWSWDLTATYLVNDYTNVYGRLAAASRAPSIQARILFAPDFAFGQDPASNGVSVGDTEDSISGEIGVKSELLDNRLRLNGAIYYYQMSDQQVSAVGGAFNTATLLNVDTTDAYGFELDLQAVPIDNLTITAGLSYNDTEFDDPNLETFACAGGCTVTDPIVGGLVQLDGNSLPHAPEWTFNGIVRYGIPFRGIGEFYGTFDWVYHDDARFFLYESAEFEDDNLELGLRVGYIHDDRYEIAVFGRNITDEEIVNSGIDFNNLVGMTNDPVTWGIQVSAKFGQ